MTQGRDLHGLRKGHPPVPRCLFRRFVLIRWDFEGHDHPIRGGLYIHVVWGLAVEQLVTVVLVVWAVGRER